MGFSRALLPPLSSRAPPGTLRALRRARETCAPRVRKGADPAAAGGCRGRGTEQDRRHLGVTSAVSSLLFGHFPLPANKSSVEPET